MTPTSVAALVTVALTLTACAEGTGGGHGDGSTVLPSGDPATAVLVVETEGGFVPVEYNLTRMPSFALYGDGSLIQPGPQIEIYPPPALPSIKVRALGPEAVQALIARAVDAGLNEDRDLMDLGSVGIVDAPATVIRLTMDGETATTRIYALGELPERPAGMPVSEWEVRRSVLSFLDDLNDLTSWLPASGIGGKRPYEAAGANLFVTPFRGRPDPAQAQVPWPLDDPPAADGEPSAGYRCETVTGGEWIAIEAAAAEATTLTPWTSADERYQVLIRPLLPDEGRCPDVT
jgi:hypothetical protein